MLRYAVLILVLVGTLISLTVGNLWTPHALWPLVVLAPLTVLGLIDLLQPSHSLLRNYPVTGHLRWLFEGIRPEIRQYLIESDEAKVPYSREQRALVYQRAKDELDKRAFGTELDVYNRGFAWLSHSIAPKPVKEASSLRVRVGGPQCTKPYDASLLNISAMSFGSLGSHAILALNKGAAAGGFYHDTGEGGISRYHRAYGADLVWEIGSGYFGCRKPDGAFDPDAFARQATGDQVRMVEVKLSQGAKPGIGGVLPARKISPEISAARGIPMDRDCLSPPRHSAFSTPIEFAGFLQRLRELSGGKPVGFKLCIGRRHEFLALLKAFLATGIYPDFIVVDGKEGGTGAAPVEFLDHVGMPMMEGLTFVHNALVGTNLRDQVRVAVAGKIVSAFDMARCFALGANWCNAARAFMFSLGCIQAQVCHTNKCPVGVTTTNPWRERALVVDEKAERVARFHRSTIKAFAELLAAAGLDEPDQLTPAMIHQRTEHESDSTDLASFVSRLAPGELVEGARDREFARAWELARAESFDPVR
jgi:glutamate synthase domain-containing protein 2